MKSRLHAALGVTAALLFCTGSAQAATFYTAQLDSFNGSGVTGTARLSLNADATRLTVLINARGLAPNQNHPGHIHGRVGDNGRPLDSFRPPPAADTDGDGFVEVAEGTPAYGPILLEFPELTDPGPEAPDGTLSYFRTFDLLDPATFSENFTRTSLLGPTLDRLDLREIVLHGNFVPPGPGAGTPGEVNGTNGYLAALPVATGEIVFGGIGGAVPEPGAWAMLIAGFGFVGGSMRSRRQKFAVTTA